MLISKNMQNLIDKLEDMQMEIMSFDDDLRLINEELKSIKKSIDDGEFKETNDLKDTIDQLEKFKEYYYVYCTDSRYGGMFGQGYAVVDKDYNYINFIRTI